MNVDLAFNSVGDAKAAKRTIAFVHGILGRGTNLRSLAAAFVDARPDYNALLLDLRGHGASPKGTKEPSIEDAARDVVNVLARTSPPVTAIVGHSLGGKVVLEAARVGETSSLQHVVTIDSNPGARPTLQSKGSVMAIIDLIESLPGEFASKSAFVEQVIAAGQTRAIAQWLAQSLEKQNDHFRFSLDLDEIRGLARDYVAQDLWPAVENPPGLVRIHLIIGDRSKTYDAADRERALQIAARNDRVTVDVLPAGHWVHVDEPHGLLRCLVDRLRE